MKLSIREDQYKIIESYINCENILDEVVMKLSILTEDGKTEPDMEWDFTNVKDEIDFSKMWVKTKEDVKKYVQILKDKIKNLPEEVKRKIMRYVMYSFIGILSLNQIQNILDPQLKQVVKTEKQAIDVANPEVNEAPRIRRSSKELLDHLRWEEGSIRHKGEPALVAYDLGDNAYTIGYGHAVFKGEREGYDFLPNYEKIIPGKTRITKKQAEMLLRDDVKIAEGIVNEILNDWEKEGIKPNLTQGMYNTLISMTYNMGRGIRTKDFLQSIKRGDFDEARELILQTSSSLFDDFPGLKIRRENEAKMFV
jgi:GH24 family phage-related lysozyme (muramidase)